MAERRRFIEIQLPGCRVFLLPEEVSRLLQRDPALFAEGLRRGKAILRARKSRERENRRCENARANQR